MNVCTDIHMYLYASSWWDIPVFMLYLYVSVLIDTQLWTLVCK